MMKLGKYQKNQIEIGKININGGILNVYYRRNN